jgi:hypothetical protein
MDHAQGISGIGERQQELNIENESLNSKLEKTKIDTIKSGHKFGITWLVGGIGGF